MSPAFRPHWTSLPAAQKRLWPQLGPVRALGYVLYGGTAIALRLGHRISVDFDFFTEQPLDHRQLRRDLPFLAETIALQQSVDTLTVATANAAHTSGVKLSFFGGIDFGRVGIPDHTRDGVLLVASLDDLMATKLKVILQRVEARDYRDIAVMIRSGVSLSGGLAAARLLFANAFQPSECLKALTWFQGGDLDTLTTNEQSILIDAASRVRDLPEVILASTRLGSLAQGPPDKWA
ncbi:MAG: nucleotidyl transferase AbiEii/AbiGii toxin family protein [Salinisphaera sp.]|nr:nucleotidyl transferase AbiEii/AbiGii toxin family protein [Salinisphaera sp.]